MAHIKIISYDISQIREVEITQRLESQHIDYMIASTGLIFVDYCRSPKDLCELLSLPNRYLFIGSLEEHNFPYWGYLHMSNWNWLNGKYNINN